MTETQQAQAAQAANGQAPAPEPEAPPDTGEKWLGIGLIAAAIFLAIVGIERVTGGKLTGAFQGSGDAEG